MTNKPGRRPGKPLGVSVVFTMRMTPQQHDKLAALGGAAWMRDKIDAAHIKPKQTNPP